MLFNRKDMLKLMSFAIINDTINMCIKTQILIRYIVIISLNSACIS